MISRGRVFGSAVISVALCMSLTSQAHATDGYPGEVTAALTPEMNPPFIAAGYGDYIEARSPDEAYRYLEGLQDGTIARASVRFGPCVLYPSPIRLRTSGKVGTKPQTKCSVEVSSIHHSTDLRYKSFIWWKLKGTREANNSREQSLQQKNVEFSCDGDERTGWASTTLGTIVYGGRTYYARVYPSNASLDCGG